MTPGGESGHSPDLRRLHRLLSPASVAVIGGGAWCANVLRECRKLGFDGPLWPVHPTRAEVGGLPAFARIEDLPGVPDAAFVGINRAATREAVAVLSARGAGGAVCFASGFREAQAELADGAALQAALLEAAGPMPILGPNCYGFVNALDRAALWPDIHGLVPVARGVAILSQSSNVALNLTMQARGLPIAWVGTVGNQAQVDLSALGQALLADDRISALGLYIEGIADLRGLEALAAEARARGKRIVAMKLGASEQSAAAAVSHTASLTGSDAGARALLRRLGVAQVSSLSAFLETLKLLHVLGPLASNRIASMSCSGGEASLMADSALGHDLEFPALDPVQAAGLRAALGPRVALANPLDYHTYIWGDTAAMTACFRAMMAGDVALGLVVLDYPRADRCDAAEWDKVLEAVAAAAVASGKPVGLLASLVEGLPEAVAQACVARGIPALCDMPAALEAVAAAAFLGREVAAGPVLLPEGPGPGGASEYLESEEASGAVLDEARAKALLARAGVPVPGSRRTGSAATAARAAEEIGCPVVLKGMGLVHKTEAGAVALGLRSAAEVKAAAETMDSPGFLVEEMVTGAVAELLVGVTRDPAHGFVLTLGAGGVLTEVLDDTVCLLLPVTGAEVRAALTGLRIGPVLAGYRGRPGVDMDALVSVVMAVQDLVSAEAARLAELEINPLICRADGAVAVDALVRLEEAPARAGPGQQEGGGHAA
jgi:acyl-CoA synthetase (NDP forming)